jgi:hypothetical protein
MLRAVVVLVLAANFFFLAFTQGWLQSVWPSLPHGQREPERMAAQVRPELVTVVPPKNTNAAVAAARAADASIRACFEAGPFAESEVAAAENVLLQNSIPAGTWSRDSVARSAPWAVYMGRFSDRDVMRQKEEELRRLKVSFEELRTPPLLAPGLRISTHPDKAAADQALAQLNEKGVRTARVVELPPLAPQIWLRVAKADADLQVRLRGLGGVGNGFQPCKAN